MFILGRPSTFFLVDLSYLHSRNQRNPLGMHRQRLRVLPRDRFRSGPIR